METTNELTIGSKCFLVHRSYANQKKWGGKIILAKVKTFENRKGFVTPIFYELGRKSVEMTVDHYIPYIDIKEAIKAIES